jgi:hypothetical protein
MESGRDSRLAVATDRDSIFPRNRLLPKSNDSRIASRVVERRCEAPVSRTANSQSQERIMNYRHPFALRGEEVRNDARQQRKSISRAAANRVGDARSVSAWRYNGARRLY